MESSVSFAVLTICVDSVKEGRIEGEICSSLLPKSIEFQDLGIGILRADEAMNGNKFPQAYMRLRSFRPEMPQTVVRPIKAAPPRSGAIATFSLRIRARRRAEWQGVLTCPDGTIAFFSSVLSLLRLIEQQLDIILHPTI